MPLKEGKEVQKGRLSVGPVEATTSEGIVRKGAVLKAGRKRVPKVGRKEARRAEEKGKDLIKVEGKETSKEVVRVFPFRSMERLIQIQKVLGTGSKVIVLVVGNWVILRLSALNNCKR